MHAGRFSVGLTFLFVFVGLSGSLYAAGGSCPSGANYLSLNNPTGPKVALSSFGITSCYYIAANGSNSNSGTSESSPWQFAPGMPNCSATCASVKPAAGEGFIFRGGDTWHFGNSSASPYTGGEWAFGQANDVNNVAWGGTSTNYVYIGVDPAWYSGSSWSRPILNADNPASTSAVSSCAYQIAGNSLVVFQNTMVALATFTYGIFDNFEMTGLCWNTNAATGGGIGGNYLHVFGENTGNGNVAYVENNYLHAWTHTTAGGQLGGNGFSDDMQNFGVIFRFNIADGSDSDPLSLNAWGNASSGYDIEYNITTSQGASNVFRACHILHDNLFEYIGQDTDSSSHSDAFFCFGEYNGGSSDPNLFYNNTFRDIGTSSIPYAGYVLAPDTPPGQTDYVFNNVFHDVSDNGGGNNNLICDNGVTQPCGSVTMFNNTFEGGLNSGGSPVGIVWSTDAPSQTVTSVNDHWIGNSGSTTSAVFGSGIGATETDPVYQTLSTANSQGYTSTNDFSPISFSAATVTTTGANETNGYCADSVLHNPAAEAACVHGITGVAYNKTNHTVVYPAFTPAARPATGAWNIGAYQFAGSSAVNPPTNLSASAH